MHIITVEQSSLKGHSVVTVCFSFSMSAYLPIGSFQFRAAIWGDAGDLPADLKLLSSHSVTPQLICVQAAAH